MYLRDLADSLLRRWMLVVVTLAMTVGVCFLTAKLIRPDYESNASIVLVPPKSVVEPTANRFLELSGLTQAADVMVRALNAGATQEQVHRSGPEGTYEVTDDLTTSAPVLIISTKAPTAGDADALVDAVLAQAPVRLSALQSSLSVSRSAEITSILIDRDVEPTVNRKSQVRSMAALSVLFLGGSAMLIGMLDGVLLVRAARKEMERRRDGDDGRSPDVAEEDAAWLEELAAISHGVTVADPAPTAARPRMRSPKPPGRRTSVERDQG